MQAKSNPKRRRLVALFATILAIVGAFVLAAKPALAEDVQGTLTITNTVTPSGDTTEFNFTVKVGTDGSAVTYKIDGGTEQSGTTPLSVKLKGGQTLTVSNILISQQGTGVEYEVSEAQVSGWTTKVGDEEKSNVTGTLIASAPAASITFTNTKINVTTKVDKQSITPKSATETAEINDIVTVASGLTAGQKYTVVGTLVDKSNKESVPPEATMEAEANQSGGLEATLTYKNVEVGKYAGKSLVSTVQIKSGDKVIAEHADLDDAAQTVEIAAIPATTGTLTIGKTISTPTTDKAVEKAQVDVDKAEDEASKEIAQDWLDDLTNHRDGNADEKVTGAKDKEFEFTVRLTDAADKDLEGEFSYTGSKEGKVKSGDTIKLKHGESIKIADLPAGAKYEVVEADATNWSCDQEKNTVSGDIKGGEEAKAAFVNTGKGTFTISKTIKAADGYELTDELKNTEFTFTVNVYDKKDVSTRKDVEGEFNYTGSKEGKLKSGDTVTLKDGESITIDVDPGVYVRVSESAKTGWTQSAKNLAGAIYDGKTRTANFTNTYSPYTRSSNSSSSTRSTSSGSTTRAATAKTADPTSIAPLATMAVGTALAAAGAVRRRK
ncbi:MAG: hypothetical protein IKF78_11355 [Atopobiaceae bacterium]|nr:hypothetical protein [Atopobiaceae bacterium]